jgi:NAD(P)-dependent dehydrogenase (short-subunit alcohol dehydrogenase family)
MKGAFDVSRARYRIDHWWWTRPWPRLRHCTGRERVQRSRHRSHRSGDQRNCRYDQKQRGRAIAIPGDVADRQAAERAVATTEAELGPIELLINNAGVLNGGLIGTIDPDE